MDYVMRVLGLVDLAWRGGQASGDFPAPVAHADDDFVDACLLRRTDAGFVWFSSDDGLFHFDDVRPSAPVGADVEPDGLDALLERWETSPSYDVQVAAMRVAARLEGT